MFFAATPDARSALDDVTYYQPVGCGIMSGGRVPRNCRPGSLSPKWTLSGCKLVALPVQVASIALG